MIIIAPIDPPAIVEPAHSWYDQEGAPCPDCGGTGQRPRLMHPPAPLVGEVLVATGRAGKGLQRGP
jgi:hypothetical protein